MKRITALFAALPSSALAHAGDHSARGLTHLLTEPDHLALIAVLVGVAAWVVYKLWSRL